MDRTTADETTRYYERRQRKDHFQPGDATALKWLNELFFGNHIAGAEFVWTASLGLSVVGAAGGLEGHHRRSAFKV